MTSSGEAGGVLRENEICGVFYKFSGEALANYCFFLICSSTLAMTSFKVLRWKIGIRKVKQYRNFFFNFTSVTASVAQHGLCFVPFYGLFSLIKIEDQAVHLKVRPLL